MHEAITAAAFQCVGDGDGRQDGINSVVECFSNAIEHCVIDEGACCIMDHHMGCFGGGKSLEALINRALPRISAEGESDV
ncbi:hypothetical protein D3C87_1617880 [compost metagenome]